MIDLYNSDINDILPPFLKNAPETQAIGYAINRQLQRLITYSNQSIIYAGIDNLPEDILDLLAVEFRSQYYADNLDIEQKRAIIKSTMVWYTKAGTPSAVNELIQTVFGEGHVLEWFDVEGMPPGTFDIVTSAPITEESIDRFNKLINGVKNTRSHIRTISAERRVGVTGYYAAAIINGMSASIKMVEPPRPTPKTAIVGSAVIGTDTIG